MLDETRRTPGFFAAHFINQQGRVYQKNLGANTAKIAGAITTYDPDPSWKLVASEQP